MGADYYAVTYLGFEVKKDDLVTVEKKTTVVCDHPSAKGTKFCPECGKPPAERSVTETVESWKNGVQLSKEDREGNFDDLVEYDGKVNGLPLIPLLIDSMTSKRDKGTKFILGVKLARVSGEGSGHNPIATPADKLVDHIKHLEKTAAALGLGSRPVQLYTLCYASV